MSQTATAESPLAAEMAMGPIGEIVSLSGDKAIVLLDHVSGSETDIRARVEIGALMRIETPFSQTIALVCAMSVPAPAENRGDKEFRILELELVGELLTNAANGRRYFRRGVSIYPSLGDVVEPASHEDLELVYAVKHPAAIPIGAIKQDGSIPAMLRVDDLLSKHFAILGATGTGKSCSVALMLRALLDRNPDSHMVVLDPHNEYAESFGEKAERVTPTDLFLPYWMFTFEEILKVLLGGDADRTREIEILREIIPEAKRKYRSGASRIREQAVAKAGGAATAAQLSADTPSPYRISDVVSLLDERMGRLDAQRDLSPYKNLIARLESLTSDPRYAFMFGGVTVEDSMVEVLSRLFRIPVDGKPITTIDLTGVPSEIVNVVVSVLARTAFDLAVWSDGATPVLLVCEEAHRYAPSDASLGFEPTKRAISRIAKEGRKYGVSLCIVSQRPSELDPTMLSQCNTIFALRMSNETDQEIVRAAVSDTANGLLEFLPALGNGEAIAFGEGVMLPVQLRFARLPASAVPGKNAARISERWRENAMTREGLSDIVSRWRSQRRASKT